MRYLRIKDWEEHFENNRTRGLKKMAWVPVPVKHDGDGYTELVSHENGAAHLGAWLAILQVASKCQMRGTLLRDNRTPHNSASISRLTRLDLKIIEEATERLCSKNIGWLEVVESVEDEAVVITPQEGAGKAQEGAGISQVSDYGKEGNGREGNNNPPIPPKGVDVVVYPKEFMLFWEAYPRKKGKGAALKKWKQLGAKRPATQNLIDAVELQKTWEDWKRDDGRYIPNPATWLNQSRWEDENQDGPAEGLLNIPEYRMPAV